MKQIKSTVTLQFCFFPLLAIDCYTQEAIRKAFVEVVDAVSVLFFPKILHYMVRLNRY